MPINPRQRPTAGSQIGQADYVAASEKLPLVSPQLELSGCATPAPPLVRDAAAGLQDEFRSVRVGRSVFPFISCEHVSRAYRSTIDRLGLGASDSPPCEILNDRAEVVGHVSYNGRVWLGADYIPDAEPLFCPSARGHA